MAYIADLQPLYNHTQPIIPLFTLRKVQHACMSALLSFYSGNLILISWYPIFAPFQIDTTPQFLLKLNLSFVLTKTPLCLLLIALKDNLKKTCVAYRVVRGGNGLVDGPALPENLGKVMQKIADQGFAHKLQVSLLGLDFRKSCDIFTF